MSQITCEYCGTEYESDMQQCPLCGTTNESCIPEAEEPVVPVNRTKKKRGGARAAQKKSNVPNWVYVLLSCVLTVAVLIGAVWLMLALDIFGGGKAEEPAETLSAPASGSGEQEQSAPEQPANAPSQPEPQSVRCTSLAVSPSTLFLEAMGKTYVLKAAIRPTDCTDPVTWISSNPAVCSVDASGLVTAFSEGSAIVTAACGELAATISVTCNFSGAPAGGRLSLNVYDVTLDARGATAELYVENMPEGAALSWSSSDESVCTVDDGKVTAEGSGTATVTATVGDEELECVVRCSFGDGGNPNAGNVENPGYQLDYDDVTLQVGESFEISVIGGRSGGWSVTDGSVISVNANGIVTGLKHGTARVYTTVSGERLECIVRVK